MTRETPPRAPAAFPRRTVLAVLLSVATAAAATGLAHWGGLGAPRTESFNYSRGLSFAEGEEARLRGYLSAAVRDDRLAVILTGHTGSSGDAAANQTLSERRAEQAAAIAREIGIPEDRITAAGVGGGAPLPKQEGQSDRAYQNALSRVDVTLRVLR